MTEAATRCVAFVLRNEGGLVNHPSDPGGVTNYGISQRAYPSLDVRALKRSEAEEIYLRDYWTPIRGDELPEPIALVLLDFAVNSGVPRALRMGLDELLLRNDVGMTSELATAIRLRATGSAAVSLAEKIVRARALFLTNLGCTRRGAEDFLSGWMRRIADNLRVIRAMEE